MRLKRVPYDEGDAPAFCAGPRCIAGEGEDRVPRQSQVGDLGLVTGRAQPGLRQEHDVDVVVLNEGRYVGPPPGSPDGSCIEEADKECFRLRKNRGECDAAVCEGDAAER